MLTYIYLIFLRKEYFYTGIARVVYVMADVGLKCNRTFLISEDKYHDKLAETIEKVAEQDQE